MEIPLQGRELFWATAMIEGSINTYENQAKDYRKKIESLGQQIGEYEGELHTLRLRVGSLEDENAKVREILEKNQDQNRRLRSDLDTETAAHIEADCLAQTKSEEAEFYKDLLDQQDCEAKYAAQINSLRAGNVKDGMQLGHAQEEVKRLRGQLQDKNSAYAELATKIASLQAERDELARQLAELERELESQRLKYNQDVGDLEAELSSVLSQLQNLMDAKMSLELEIACYKKLLEGEESRVGLRAMVEQAIGTQSKGAAALKDVVQQSSLKESTGSLTVQRSSKGAIGFASIDHSGGNVVIENTTSGARAKNQNIRGWRLVKNVGGRATVDIPLKDFDLNSGRSFTVWAKGAKDKTSVDNEMISDSFSFGVGTCVWKLIDEQGNEKATLKAQFSG
ncbi:intermediate filament protein [Elysia marginata]|uniref:Intermediate filament protein n=1 Tax=Elysia marginata TaxID=1093978 RepID=A0AAV4EPD1_9GAST|nr:intermediate filament protein [Elysia marginata]